jgi:hypothetical protein
MSIRSSSLAGKASSPLHIKARPLAIRSLDRRRWNAPPIDRIRGEFAEMRGFSPTLPQAARLFNLPLDECHRVLTCLVQDGSLKQGDDGRYRLRIP